MIELILMKGVMLALQCNKLTLNKPKEFKECIKVGIPSKTKQIRKKIYNIINKKQRKI